eukprot:276352-Karenia_brevis.AAC.1
MRDDHYEGGPFLSSPLQILPAKHLPYEHPRLEGIRNFVEDTMDQDDEYHPEMFANFDQTWCVKFTPSNKMLAESPNFSPMDKYALRSSICTSIQEHLEGLGPKVAEASGWRPKVKSYAGDDGDDDD